MSEKVSIPVSSGAAKAATPDATRVADSSGKVGPGPGKISPAQAASIQAMNLDEVVERLNVQSKSIGRALRFRVDLVRGFSVIQVMDRDTGELIRQIPPQALAALASGNTAADLQLLDDLV